MKRAPLKRAATKQVRPATKPSGSNMHRAGMDRAGTSKVPAASARGSGQRPHWGDRTGVATRPVAGGGAAGILDYMQGLTLGEDLLLYVRSSDREQVTSCDEQLTVALTDCVAAGVMPKSRRLPREHTPAAGVYVDEFTSAWKKRPSERPACRELLEFCAANPGTREHPRYVWLWELSRFLRAKGGALEAFQWVERLRELGWFLLCHVEGPFRVTRDNRFGVVMQLLMHTEKATSESETREDRGFRGKGDRFARGVWPAGEAPFGYERWAVRVSFDEHTLEPIGAIEWLERLPVGKRNAYHDSYTVLRPAKSGKWAARAIRWYADGYKGRVMSAMAICRRLDQAGIPAPGGGHWRPTTIRNLVANRAYIAQKEMPDGEVLPGLWEPLVSEAVWQRAQKRVAENRVGTRGVNADYVLSGRIRCARCEAPFSGARGGRAKPGVQKNGYYRVNAQDREQTQCPGCSRAVRKDLVEELVRAECAKLADHPKVRETVALEIAAARDRGRDAVGDLHDLDEQIADRQRRIKNLLPQLEQGGAVEKEVTARLAELNQEVASLQSERRKLADARARRRGDAQQYAAAAAGFTRVFEMAAPAERKQLMRAFVHSVEVDVEKRKLRVNFLSLR